MNESLRHLRGEEPISPQETQDVLDQLAQATNLLDLLRRADEFTPPEIDLWSILTVGEPGAAEPKLYVHCPAPISPTHAIALGESMREELSACLDADLPVLALQATSLSYRTLEAEVLTGLCNTYRDQMTQRGAEIVGVTRASASVTDGLTLGRWREAECVLEIAAWMLGALTDDELGPRGVIDPVTGVHTKGFFEATLDRELAHHQRAPSELSVILLQLRRSSPMMADESPSPMVLAQTGGTMQRELRAVDLVARLDGRRLAALLPSTGPRDGLIAATRMGEALQDNDNLEGWSIDIGVSGVGLETASPAELIDQAEHAMSSARDGSSKHPFVYV